MACGPAQQLAESELAGPRGVYALGERHRLKPGDSLGIDLEAGTTSPETLSSKASLGPKNGVLDLSP